MALVTPQRWLSGGSDGPAPAGPTRASSSRYFEQAGTIVPELSSVEDVKHFRCIQKNHYRPFKPSFECRNRARGKVVKGLYPSEGAKTLRKTRRSPIH